MTIFRTTTAAFLAAGLMVSAAHAEIHIDEARFEAGVLTVRGETTLPNTTVTLDGTYKTKSGRGGDFEFSVRYKPRLCMADIRAGSEIFSAVVANCYSPGDAGTGALNRTGTSQPK